MGGVINMQSVIILDVDSTFKMCMCLFRGPEILSWSSTLKKELTGLHEG